MKKQNIKNSSLIVLFFIFSSGFTQESINASGGDISSAGGSIAFSIGQLVYTTNTSSNTASASQGVQQAFEISTLSVEGAREDITMSAYPNPTANQVFINIGNYKQEEMSYQLFDLKGRMLSQDKITSEMTSIDMSDYASGAYLVYVLSEDHKINKTIKIIKK